MKRVFRVFSLTLALILIGAITAQANAEEFSLSWMTSVGKTEADYRAAKENYTMDVYRGEAQTIKAPRSLKVGDTHKILFTAKEAGQYEIWLSYKNTSQSILPTELSVMLDGVYPFREMRSIQLRSLWVDDGVFPVDRYGNQMSMIPYAADTVLEAALSDSSARTLEHFLFELTSGEHELTITVTDGEAELLGLSLRAPIAVPAYVGGDTAGESIIVIEGENIQSRNDSSIRSAGEYTPTLSPYSAEKNLQNHLSANSFYRAGDVVTYGLTVENTGWYRFGAYYRQGAREDFPVYVDLLIDGELPSEAAAALAFNYCDSFQYMEAAINGQPQAFYLEAGEHTLSLRINADRLLPVFELIEALNSNINGLSQEVIRLSGGVSTDKYRSYNLLGSIPNLPDVLNGWAQQCEDMLAYLGEISPAGKITAFSYLQLSAVQLRRLAEKPEDLPRRINELSTGTNSVAKYLSQLLSELSYNNLAIDQIYFYQDQAMLPSKTGALQAAAQNVQRFVHSFSSRDYSISTSEKGHLQVWMGESRAFVETLQSMIDSDFTEKTGIVVDLSIMPNESKLVLSNAAGTAPDVALSMGLITPSYLDIRGALYDLTTFDDFAEVAQRFNSNLFVPFIYGDGVYALPQQVNFWVLFYRADILESLGLTVPNTLEDVKRMLPELQAYGMNFYYPTAGMSGTRVFDGTLPLIMQSGGAIYAKTIGETTLDSEEALTGFRELTELFTIYSLPVDAGSGFYQRFRDGTMPIGISNLWSYNVLVNAAPELKGLWDIAIIPGLADEEGNVSRWTTGAMKGMGIMASTDMPEEAWAFLKWWSSARVQSTYANLMFTTYGQDCLWTSANEEAFSLLPIKNSHKQVILEQMEWMKDAPWCLATYMVERELSNAFISVVVEGMDARRALDRAVKRIDRETFRKLEEFGYYKDGVMVKEYATPDVALIEKLVGEHNASQEEAR